MLEYVITAKGVNIMRLLLALTLFLIPMVADAQSQCDKREVILAQLSEKFKEQPIALGVTNSGGLVEVLSAENDGSWSIIVTNGDGLSCLVAAGEAWRSLKRKATGPDV